MPITLNELCTDWTINRGEITLGRRKVPARALTAHESSALAGLFLRPCPPPVTRPGTHPEHGPIFYNESDPTYAKARDDWRARLMVLELAAAIDLVLTVNGHTMGFEAALAGGNLHPWAAAAVAGLTGPGSPLGTDDIVTAWNQVRDLSDLAGANLGRIEAAKKALSALSRQEAAALLLQIFPPGTD